MGNENSGIFPLVGMYLSRIITTTIAKKQLIPWHIKVAHARPATPILRPTTKKIFMPTFAIEEQAKNLNGVLESPKAVKTPFAML